MTTILHVDFAGRSRTYTKQELPPDLKRVEAEIVNALQSGMSLCEYAEAFGGPTPEMEAAYDATFGLYESSLGYVAPESDPA